MVLAVSLSSLMTAQTSSADAGIVATDSGSAAFNRYVLDVRERMQSIDTGSYWISTLVDESAFQRYLAVLGESAGGPGLNDTASYLASLDVRPLRTFNSYLAYLGKRMHADAGPAGALLENDRGTMTFDRYIEDINYRIQSLYSAEDLL
jgi:hypothetical protein